MPQAFLIAGTHSGCGKTTITLGIMAALGKKGLQVQPFKCGPDFIDPTLHKLVTGQVSRNLDLWMCGHDFVKACFVKHGKENGISVVEGVMGLFDGGESSSAALAKVLDLPVVLVVDARSTAESMAAVVKGFETLDPQVRIAGVIFNRVGSPRHLELLSTAVKKHCQTEILGYLPREANFTIPDRHLGLHMGDEAPISTRAIDHLATTVTKHINLDRLHAISGNKSALGIAPYTGSASRAVDLHKVRVGIARDHAFCFYYEDNLDLLRNAGAEIIEFSPLADNKLPPGLDAIYLGGGYPELYAQQLSKNKDMRDAIKAWSTAGKPLYAECGGLMYLTEGITDTENRFFPLAGVYPVRARMKKGRVALGYRQALLVTDSIFGKKGQKVRGHEFHYSEIDTMDNAIERLYYLDDGRQEGYMLKNTLGSYMHLHFGFSPEIVDNFVQKCRNN